MDEEAREPLLDMIANLSGPDMSLLFETLHTAHESMIYETTEEHLLMDQFMTSLWIAAKGEQI
jgi:Na+/pantothenate symporter